MLQDSDEHAVVLLCGNADPVLPALKCQAVVALQRPIGSLIVGPDGVSARIWTGQRCMNAPVRVIAETITLMFEPTTNAIGGPTSKAFPDAGRNALTSLREPH